jgi:hypothetical protein
MIATSMKVGHVFEFHPPPLPPPCPLPPLSSEIKVKDYLDFYGVLEKPVISQDHTDSTVRGASKIKLEKVNKKRTVTVRRVIIFLNI